MSEKDEKTAEVESLNEGILNPDEATLDELEQVSGGVAPLQDEDCGTNCGTNSCGTYG